MFLVKRRTFLDVYQNLGADPRKARSNGRQRSQSETRARHVWLHAVEIGKPGQGQLLVDAPLCISRDEVQEALARAGPPVSGSTCYIGVTRGTRCALRAAKTLE